MDKHCTQGFGIVGLEAFDHELDRSVVLIRNSLAG